MSPQMDTYKHQGMRKKLVEEIQRMGVTDPTVLEAVNAIPRHFFLDPAFEKQAYENTAFQIGAGQTISQPFTVGIQSQLLEIKRGEKVLEIGTGSGYQTAVLCKMGARVFSIERQRYLYDRTRKLLPKLGYNAKLFYGDGYQGKETFAPFDKAIVTCGAPFIPEALIKQLRIGGILVIPVGEGNKQFMKKIIRTGEDSFELEEHGTFSFVPMLESKQ